MSAKTPTPHDPRLSEIIPSSLPDCDEEDAKDALLWWAQLTGKIPENWQQPSESITIDAVDFGQIKSAAHGLRTVARLSQIVRAGGTNTPVVPWIACGLDSAVCALADQIDDALARHGTI